jgi:hypothetical protein
LAKEWEAFTPTVNELIKVKYIDILVLFSICNARFFLLLYRRDRFKYPSYSLPVFIVPFFMFRQFCCKREQARTTIGKGENRTVI